MSRAAKLTGQAVWASAGQLAQALLAMVGTILLARLLGAETYGIFALGLLFVGFADILVGGHAADIVVQKDDVTDGHRNATFASLLAIGFAASLAVGAIGPLVADHFAVPVLDELLAAMMVLPMLSAIGAVPTQLLVRRLAFDTLARIGALSALAALAVGTTLALSGAGLWSLAAMEIARRLVTLFLLVPAVRWSPGRTFSRRELGEVLRFASRRVENFGLTFFSQNALPRLFIGQWLGTEALGLFTVARRLLDQLNNVLSGPVAAVAFPAASRLQADRAKLARLIETAIRLTTWVFWPMVLGIVVVAPLLVPVAFGDSWSPAVPVLQILALGTLRVPVSSVNTAVLVAFGRMNSVSFVSILSIAVGIAFLSVGVQFGLVGVAAALALRQWVLWPVSSHQVYRVSGLRPARQLGVMILAALPSLAMVLCVGLAAHLLVLQSRIAELALLVGIGVVCYAVAWAACNPRQAVMSFGAFAHIAQGDIGGAKKRLAAVITS